MIILAFADGLASIIGIIYPIKTFQLTGDKKSIAGSLTFFITTFILLTITLKNYQASTFQNPNFYLWLVIIAIILSFVEALGSKGWDNFLIPIAALFFLEGIMNELNFQWASFAFIISIGFVLLAVYYHLLTLSGAIVAAILGIGIVYTLDANFLIPLFAFFGSSAMIGKIFKIKIKESYNQGNPRNHWQVISNGGSYFLIAMASLWLKNELMLQMLLLISMAVATGDTWSSEIGIYFNKKTIDIITFKVATKGISGGISLPGTLAALFGAMIIAVLGFVLMDSFTLYHFMVITCFGFAGMLLDSILGSLFQARYKNKKGEIAENNYEGYTLEKGFIFFNNNAVNLLSNLLLVLAAWWVLG